MSKLAIIICATSQYQHCLLAQARAVQQNLSLAGFKEAEIILSTCENTVPTTVLERYKTLLRDGSKAEVIALPVKEEPNKNFGVNALLLISQLYSAAFDRARAIGADFTWTLEADVIPDPNNLRCMRDMLAFDGGYYDVAFCPYTSSGGGGIMGGRGSHRNWIYPNWWEEEIALPEELAAEMEMHKKLQGEGHPSKEWEDKWRELAEKAKQHPPIGNVFVLNAKAWRPRGWLEWAYPAIGKGAALPSDWMPMGNNLLSNRALQFADFTSYTGRGTQDLFLSYKLAAQGFRFCVIPHSPCAHVIRKENTDSGPFTLLTITHEREGDGVGHLRQHEHPFYSGEPGELLPVIAADYSI